jgi:putative membrane protein
MRLRRCRALDNATAQSLKFGGPQNVKHEIAYHQRVLDALDKTLIPGAQNAELKALLVKVRPAFVAHLEHAKMVQKSLK